MSFISENIYCRGWSEEKFFCMASRQRVGETGLSGSGPSNQHMPYAVLQGIGHPATNLINQQGPAFDFGELEEAIVLQGIKLGDDAKKAFFTARPAATLEMFPSWPMRFQQTSRGSSKSGEESSDSGSGLNTDAQLEPESPISNKAPPDQALDQRQLQVEMRKGAPSSTSEKVLDAKTLRRLAQNREAARKSRLRKKAYVQQLESSRIKLSQLEQDLQRARSQGLLLGVGGSSGGNISSGAALFDMEYGRWLEDEQRHMSELRTGLQAHLSDGELRLIVDRYLSHYDEIFHLKGVTVKSDVFHLITGMWNTPAERCFLWMGGFRPSELIKILMAELDAFTEQQLIGICSLKQSSQQAEEALSQGLEQLHHSLSDTIASDPLSSLGGDGIITNNNNHVADYMGQMALALAKLSNLEGFVRQADNLRQQTLHQIRRILTVRQAARSFLAIGEYYDRLRALSTLWATRPRENMIGDDSSYQTTTELQMVQTTQSHFSNY
ncbi:transcription factor TGA2.2-like isoform X5 [Macadamia integrifolia]|uniref:transcription factor TGA2.2-like isoform X5 n=1 Tax=Macadamia integrifolia TaxID=60698 RepID=UPI001C4E5834|nr:transcription factor TGA2.2-like isoform X5 [Macadamia integrifolia]